MPADPVQLISGADVHSGVTEMAREIDRDYASTGLVIVSVLKGATIFTADLLRVLQAEVHRLEFVRASSYGAGTTSWGRVGITGTLDAEHVRGQHVLVVDDIIDTGHTCAAITSYLKGLDPASLRYCALLDKPEGRQVEVQCDYVGFTIPSHFVIGYGMDLNERYRGLPGVYYFPDA